MIEHVRLPTRANLGNCGQCSLERVAGRRQRREKVGRVGDYRVEAVATDRDGSPSRWDNDSRFP